MTYVVTEACIKCKYTDCVEVCPVDCFYEGENMLVIHPDECIDCGVCEPECPADAIKPDTEPGLEKWLEVNTEYAKTWPNITQKKDQPPDAKDFEGDGRQVREIFFQGARHRRLIRTRFTRPVETVPGLTGGSDLRNRILPADLTLLTDLCRKRSRRMRPESGVNH